MMKDINPELEKQLKEPHAQFFKPSLPGGEKKIKPLPPTSRQIMEKLESIDRKLDRIFGNICIIRGPGVSVENQWEDLSPDNLTSIFKRKSNK